jgi:hypothetical protein
MWRGVVHLPIFNGSGINRDDLATIIEINENKGEKSLTHGGLKCHKIPSKGADWSA